jgi:hypothetical protein
MKILAVMANPFGPDAVMPALVAGIHAHQLARRLGVDGRDKPGHDAERLRAYNKTAGF